MREGGRLQWLLPTSKCLRVLCLVSMFTQENWCWDTHLDRTHTPCACTCVDIPYLLFLLQNIHTQPTHTHTHRPGRPGLISGPSELREAFNQGQHTALGISLIPPSPHHLSLTHSPHAEPSCWLNISQQHFVPEKLKLDHWRLKIVSHL